MNSHNDPNPDIEKTVFPQGPTGMPSARAASELLARLNARATDPIDGLLETLCSGKASPAQLMREWVRGQPDDAELWQRVTKCQADPDELNKAKELAKLGFHPKQPPAHRDSAMLAYLLAVAAGLVSHGKNISSVDHEVLEEWLTAVAGATPGQPVSELFSRAAGKIRKV